MPIFERGDVVRVPFPYTDGRTTQHRPALVVSDGQTGDGGHLIWVVMITSASNRPWAGDVPLGAGFAPAGLPAPSVIRPTKVATIDVQRASAVGRITPATLAEVDKTLDLILGR